MKTECLVMAMDSVLKEKRSNPVFVLVNLLTTERNIVKNIFSLLKVLFYSGKNFDHYSIFLANDKKQYSLSSLGNDYTEEDILNELKEDNYYTQRTIHEMVEELKELGGEVNGKITVKLL